MQAQPTSNRPSASTAGSLRFGTFASVSIAIDRLVLARLVELALELRRQLHHFGLVDVPRLRQTRVQVDLNAINGTGLSSTAFVGFLLGDIVGATRAVNSADILGVQSFSLQTTNATNFKADLNFSGAINSADIGIVRASSLHSIP